ncbi:restriction endonuclease [Cereibacter sphaeroides]|uniref:EcoRII N-terminal effector-binding domain-containing protein n=1 Tax=Cereibacter sphaeroides TaxID=1063 RepID=UPI001F1B20F3|nr:EcoRII N-terminal effector-binding domain-containing protein [Cereibacter sphaeroides]MCE6957978.1 restriction endonuclease [Cereibacter sphaeroides]MCE6971785.1 restriction endonuclease [Cereibacter sphaeroides]
MTKAAFRKTLSANDVGSTGGHQAGVLIPKGEKELLAILPPLDPSIKNPSAWLTCVGEDGVPHKFRFVYYNNRLHDENGTRNEYRITYMTAWFRDAGAKAGDVFEIGIAPGQSHYGIRVIRPETEAQPTTNEGPVRIKLRGWSRVH